MGNSHSTTTSKCTGKNSFLQPVLVPRDAMDRRVVPNAKHLSVTSVGRDGSQKLLMPRYVTCSNISCLDQHIYEHAESWDTFAPKDLTLVALRFNYLNLLGIARKVGVPETELGGLISQGSTTSALEKVLVRKIAILTKAIVTSVGALPITPSAPNSSTSSNHLQHPSWLLQPVVSPPSVLGGEIRSGPVCKRPVTHQV
jgi:hypothetical protein